MAYIRPLEIILAKKTTELVLLFNKNITNLVFLWPNNELKSFKMLIILEEKTLIIIEIKIVYITIIIEEKTK